jgi:hypothetical protein
MTVTRTIHRSGSRRVAALAGLLLLAAFFAFLVIGALRAFPWGVVACGLVVVAATCAWTGALHRGNERIAFLVLAGALLIGAIVLVLVERVLFETLLAVGFLVAAVAFAKLAFVVDLALPPAEPPKRAALIWNPRSGGGKAVSNNLAEEARARGIEPIELKPGDDLEQLVRDAVARGADGLAAAGGDGTQALIASYAAAHDLPFACIPAGTRNHFALDLGVDRDDVVGALDAFVNGGERRVDLAEVNGRTFVNNVSLGLYAEAVQRKGYRDAKLRTILDTVPVLDAPDGTGELRFTDGDGVVHDSAAVVLVSNNVYRLGRLLGSGTRPTLSAGVLGVAAARARGGPRDGGGSRAWTSWSAPAFEIDSAGPVPVGVDGEALRLDPPLRFAIRPGALRVRFAPQHHGASPSAGLPATFLQTLRAAVWIACGADPDRGPGAAPERRP